MNSRSQLLIKQLEQKILILDGAIGTMIQQLNLVEKEFRGDLFVSHSQNIKGNYDILNLSQPEIVKNIYKQYLEAGADIITTNTFNANSISQTNYGLENHIYEINYKGAKLACSVAAEYNTSEKPRFVAGSIGPTSQMLSYSIVVNNPISKGITFDMLVDSYYEQVRGLYDGGINIFLIETICDIQNAKAAISAIKRLYSQTENEIPIILSATIDKAGRILSGQTLEDFYVSLKYSEALSFGLNCAFGAEHLKPYVELLSKISSTFITVYPNAGLPNELGLYALSATEKANIVEELCGAGLVNIVGGCCGTTPEYIAAIANMTAKYKPRKVFKY